MTTALTWDILYGDGVVISENQNGQTTSYTYGLERISAISGSTRTEYVYDGRGSVAAEVSYNNAWYGTWDREPSPVPLSHILDWSDGNTFREEVKVWARSLW